jgi:hypothetical protein
MRPLGWLAIGVVLGAILGGIPARRELEQTRTALATARAKPDPAPRRDGKFLPFDLARPRPQKNAEKDAPDTGKAREATEAVTAPPVPQDPEDRRRQFALAVDAQRVRIAQNRAALIEESDLDESELQRFDAIVADLNADLVEYSDLFVDMALDQDEVSSAGMLSVTHDVTGVLHDSQMAFDELLGSPAAANDDARQVWNYIDLETFRPAVEELGAQPTEGPQPP